MARSNCTNFVLGSRTVKVSEPKSVMDVGCLLLLRLARILSLAAAVPAGAQSNSSITDLDYSLMRILIPEQRC